MRIQLTRDSVAMGDDADAPHAVPLELNDGASLGDAVGAVLAVRYLARVQGGSTWVAVEGGPALGVPIRDRPGLAVIAEKWSAPRWVAEPTTAPPAALHFKYLGGLDPEEVHTRMVRSARAARREP